MLLPLPEMVTFFYFCLKHFCLKHHPEKRRCFDGGCHALLLEAVPLLRYVLAVYLGSYFVVGTPMGFLTSPRYSSSEQYFGVFSFLKDCRHMGDHWVMTALIWSSLILSCHVESKKDSEICWRRADKKPSRRGFQQKVILQKWILLLNQKKRKLNGKIDRSEFHFIKFFYTQISN